MIENKPDSEQNPSENPHTVHVKRALKIFLPVLALLLLVVLVNSRQDFDALTLTKGRLLSLKMSEASAVDLECDRSFTAERRGGRTRITCPTPMPSPSPGPSDTPEPTGGNQTTPTSATSPTQAVTPPPPPPGGGIQPFPNAPSCAALGVPHNGTTYHGIWNYEYGCHYDHEHGDNPFTSEFWSRYLAEVGQQLSYPWATPNENVIKHAGYKYHIRTDIPCVGRENSPLGVSDALIISHGVGDYEFAMATPFHSSYGVIRICDVDNPSDNGVLASGGWQNFGQRTSPYQGAVLDFDYTTEMGMIGEGYSPYDPAREPYISIDCVGDECNRTLANVTGNSTWISEPVNLFGNELFAFLFRVRDAHSVVDGFDPAVLNFLYVCSNDGGQTYTKQNCRNNNTASLVHEIMGTIPQSWDSLDGSNDGHVTYNGYTDRWGRLNQNCSSPGLDCVPLYMDNVPVGRYGMQHSPGPDRQPFHQDSIPDRDVYFCGGNVCSESSPGSVPSGWVNVSN